MDGFEFLHDSSLSPKDRMIVIGVLLVNRVVVPDATVLLHGTYQAMS